VAVCVALAAWLVVAVGPVTWAAGRARDGGLAGLPAWDEVQAPDGRSDPSELRGVQAFSASNVWTVGHTGDSTLIEHWNGSSFAVVRSPNVPGRANILEDADGVAPNDVWAVGHADRSFPNGSSSLIEHWNGTGWSIVPTPNLGTSGSLNELSGVTAVASDDVWAAGIFQKTGFGTQYKALLQHWDGSAWRIVPNVCGFGLSDLDARSATDVWAVGGSDACHWDGSSWTRFPAGIPPNAQAFVDLFDVAVVAQNEAWAVGQ
jgi:hypothetical protein